MPATTERQKRHITLNDAAAKLNVSVATIRNWIKTGYLSTNTKNLIETESLARFELNVAGVEKLKRRANKSLLDTHDHRELQAEFQQRINRLDNTELDTVGHEYEQALSNSYRNREGIYYTPQRVVDDFFDHPLQINNDTTFLDPCCGSGNFVLKAIDQGINPSNVYGYDIDPVAVELCRTRIRNLTGVIPENIVCADFLQQTMDGNYQQGFDIIYTNPPWGKKIPADIKRALGRQLGSNLGAAYGHKRSLDTSSLFFYACLERLNDDGFIGFLMPDAFFNIAAFADARKVLLDCQLVRITDYGKPFKSLLTGASGFIACKCSTPNDQHWIECRSGNQQHQRLQSSFRTNPKTIINHQVNASTAELIEHLYSGSHISLKTHATWALGIVTGNNRKHLANNPDEDRIPVHRGTDISDTGLAAATHFVTKDFKQLQQVASSDIYNAKEKIVYRFISSNLCFYCDTQQSVFLNSANMFVLEPTFALNHRQLTWLLNSKLMNWLFQNLFNTHKVLRSDLESLPIFYEYFSNNDEYTEEGLHNYLGIEYLEGNYRLVNANRETNT